MSQAVRGGNGASSATGNRGRKLGFPMMSVDEIYNCLDLLGINCQLDDLTRPTAASTRVIWLGLLEILCGINPSQIESPKDAILNKMQYKELYSEGLGFLMFFHHCRDLADRCGFQLNVPDLSRPDPLRLRTALSGVLNFAKFREENLGLPDKLEANIELINERIVQLQMEKDKKDAAIDDLKTRQKEDQSKVEIARERNEALRNELRGLSEEQRQLSGEYERLKQDRHALSKEGKERTAYLEDVEARTNEAKARLVQSPDRIRKNISEMGFQVATEKDELKRTTEKLHEHTKRLEVLQGLETELKRLIVLGNMIATEQQTTEQLRRDKEELQAAVDQARIEGEQLKERNDHVKLQVSFAEEKLNRQRERFDETNKRGKARIAELTAEYNQKDKERAVMEAQLAELQNEEKLLDQEMEEYIAKNQTEIRKLLESYKNLRQRADHYMEEVASTLNFSQQPQD